MLQTRFKGSLVNQRGHIWTAEILQDNPTPYATVAPLTFDADEPITIEWPDTQKYEPIAGATATLNIISPADRTYIDMYQVQPGHVMLRLSLDNKPYWQGTLDCETYEEPYQAAAGYTVTLTFTDFGCLDRLKFSALGRHSVKWYITHCMQAAGLDTTALTLHTTLQHTRLVTLTDGTTTLGNWAKATLDEPYIDAANFYDEDGTPATLHDVLQAVMQPLALRIIQRAGHTTVYDTNAMLQNPPATAPITWDADEQTLSVDTLAQEATIKFSPYGTGDLITTDTATIKTDLLTQSEKIYNSLFNPYGIGLEGWGSTFTFHHSPANNAATGITYKHPQAQYFALTSDRSKDADGSQGIARLALTNPLPRTHISSDVDYKPDNGHGDPKDYCTDTTVEKSYEGKYANPTGVASEAGLHGVLLEPLFTMPRVWCPAATYNQPYYSLQERALQLQLTMELLIDTRYNPFNTADPPSIWNEKGATQWADVRKAAVLIPYMLRLYNEQGKNTYTLTLAGWTTPDLATTPSTYLAYYSNEWATDRNKPATSGWTKNKYSSGLYLSFKQNDTPEYEPIPLPPEPGYLELQILTGAAVYDDADIPDRDRTDYYPNSNTYRLIDMNKPDPANLRAHSVGCYSYFINYAQRWMLYKFPTLTLVRNSATNPDPKPDDAEYKAWVNPQAKDNISIDTTCGTMLSDMETARGAYRTADGQKIYLRRTNTATNPDDLRIEYDLLGLIFSQYATRHTILEGEAITPTAPLTLFTERAQPATARFITMGETLNAITGTSTLKVVELTPETWTANILQN